jgi:hypothetical protein
MVSEVRANEKTPGKPGSATKQGGRRPQLKNPAAGRKSQVEGEGTYEEEFLSTCT